MVCVAGVSAAGPQFSTYLGGKWGEFATGVATDAAGNIYVAGQTGSPDFAVTAGAAQTTFGGGSDVFVAKFSPDGSLLWCTFYGGNGSDGARGIGVDAAGNVIVAGSTTSTDLRTVNAIETSIDNGHLRYGQDAFVIKLDPTGSRFLYATYLGGDGNDWAWAVAVDPAGNAYIVGDTGPTEFFPGPDGVLAHPSSYMLTFAVKFSPEGRVVFTSFLDNLTVRGIALDHDANIYLTGTDTKYQSLQDAQVVVSKLSADGSRELYRTAFGGSLFNLGTAIAVDASGRAYITGMTQSADFPLVNPLQSLFGARALWKSSDSTATWKSIGNAPFGMITAAVASAGTLYVASPDGGIFVSPDGGATWRAANNGLTDKRVNVLVRDPATGTLYAGTSSGVFKSTDGAQTWNSASSGLPSSSVLLLATDPTHPGSVYAAGASGKVYKTTDAGATWNPLTALNDACGNCTQALAVDPNTGNVYASSVPPFIPPNFFNPPPPAPPKSTLFRSTDGGASWNNDNNVFSTVYGLLVDATTQPSTIYAGLVARSDDGGVTWNPIKGPLSYGDSSTAAVVDPSTGAIYSVVQYPSLQIYVSYDHANTWQPAPGTPFTGPQGTLPAITGLVADPASPGAMYAIANSLHTTAFVAQLSADGATLLFSTFLGGHAIFRSRPVDRRRDCICQHVHQSRHHVRRRDRTRFRGQYRGHGRHALQGFSHSERVAIQLR